MNKQILISFLDKVKRPNSGNKFVDGLLTILTIPLYPILLLFGLLIMLFLGGIAIWQRVTTSEEDVQKEKQAILEEESKRNQWTTFTSADNILINRQLAGSLPWDSGDYLHLKSEPPIAYLEDKLFGDWLLVGFGGVFLQRWNDPRKINCDLIFIDYSTLKVTEIKVGLPTKNWTAERLNAEEIRFSLVYWQLQNSLPIQHQ